METDRLLIREVIDTDIANIFLGLSNPQVTKHYGVSYDSLEATKEQMLWYDKPQQHWWVICSKDEQEFYGAAGFNDISNTNKKAEIGLWLLPDFWGKGIMTEVMPLICQYAFDQMGLHRIEGFVESSNHNCKRAMSKLDFKHEGTMQECEIKNGEFISVDIYALLKN